MSFRNARPLRLFGPDKESSETRAPCCSSHPNDDRRTEQTGCWGDPPNGILQQKYLRQTPGRYTTKQKPVSQRGRYLESSNCQCMLASCSGSILCEISGCLPRPRQYTDSGFCCFQIAKSSRHSCDNVLSISSVEPPPSFISCFAGIASSLNPALAASAILAP